MSIFSWLGKLCLLLLFLMLSSKGKLNSVMAEGKAICIYYWILFVTDKNIRKLTEQTEIILFFWVWKWIYTLTNRNVSLEQFFNIEKDFAFYLSPLFFLLWNPSFGQQCTTVWNEWFWTQLYISDSLFERCRKSLGLIWSSVSDFMWRRWWHPTPILLPGKFHGRRSLVGWGPYGREELDATELLRFHFSLSHIGEGNGNPLQCSCLENARDGGAWWAAIYGVTQSRTQLKWLSSSEVTKLAEEFHNWLIFSPN